MAEMDRCRDTLGHSLPAQRIRWIAPENWHLTLRFLGDVSDTVLADLNDFLAKTASRAPTICWTGSRLSYLPSSKRPKVMAIEGDASEALGRLASAIHSKDIEGAQAFDYPRFRPHVSLVRFGSTEKSFPDELDDFFEESISIQFTEMALYRSQLSEAGSIYQELGVWPLNGP